MAVLLQLLVTNSTPIAKLVYLFSSLRMQSVLRARALDVWRLLFASMSLLVRRAHKEANLLADNASQQQQQ
jgi:hypothetical protein